jgi:3-deoxy-manno-octulosonate cytidylyltransferase (CMP-KDO synthetase)
VRFQRDTLPFVKAVAIIPARYASSRFPGKLLAQATGKYLIQHVYEQASRAKRLSEIIVAADDQRIADAVRSFGARVMMTRPDHPSGTDRVAEVAVTLDADLIVNVQGDEPEIEPAHIDQLVDLMATDAGAPIGTLACPFPNSADLSDPNAVKVVLDARGRAMYFSRALIPYPRNSAGRPTEPSRWLLHLGIYAYQRDFLLKLAQMPPTPHENEEKLEQLRVLENGFPIAVGIVNQATVGIDTPDDYTAFVERFRKRK